MASQINLTRLKNRTWLHGLVAILLAGFILLIGAAGYSTAEPESVPADTYPPSGHRPLPSHDPFAQSTTFAPFLNMVPSEDGTELFISAGGVGELGGTVFANIDLGPGHDKGGWTMTYSDTVRSYVTSATGFTPNTSMSGAINITTTIGPMSRPQRHRRSVLSTAICN
jgi:hypothetical protein